MYQIFTVLTQFMD